MDPSVYSEQVGQLVAACHYISAKGLTSSSGGNLSLRLADGNILITPTGMPKEQVTADKICILDAAGRTLFCPEGCSPTSETPFHIMALSRRPDIVSVVHAHPVMLSAFAVAQTHLLEYAYYPEEAMEIGPIVKVPYDEPSCTKLADRLSEYIHLSNGFLLENHGAVVLSQFSVSDAVERMYMMEATAIIGIDAIADAVNSVANGGMTATILQDGQGQGASALETVVKVIKGESFEKTVNIPFILITKDNVADYQ